MMSSEAIYTIWGFKLTATNMETMRKFEVVPEQDKQCTYNVTLRHIHETIVAVEKKYVLHILNLCL